MADLDSLADCRKAFYRLTGTTAADAALTENGESANEVVDLYLTRGARGAQRELSDLGLAERWQKTARVTFWAAALDGTRTGVLPPDFWRLSGDRTPARSALKDASTGKPWGTLVDAEDLRTTTGDAYALLGETLKVAPQAALPASVQVDYLSRHPALSDDLPLDLPPEARWLAVSLAAEAAMDEAWLPGGPEMEAKLSRALRRARAEAKAYAQRSRAPRQMRAPVRYGTRW